MYNRASNARFSGTRQYAATRNYAGSRYAGTRYYGNSGYYGGNRYYYGGGYPNYGYSNYGYSYWPYVAASAWPYVASSFSPYGSYGNYPYSYYGGSPNTYSYYQPGYGYNGSTVAAVQRRLGELGYYRGAVDGVIGPRTRAAIAAFESTNGMAVDGVISTRLLNRMGVG